MKGENMINHQDDKLFRATVLNSVSTEPRNTQGVLTDLIERQGYKVTVADVQGRLNGKNPTSVLIHRVNTQLDYLAKDGTIQLEKVKGRKYYRLIA
jgi:hypothetical protein